MECGREAGSSRSGDACRRASRLDPTILIGGAAIVLASWSCNGTDSILAGRGGYGPGHARVSLIADAGALVPGQGITLGVSFDIEPRWHLYWNGQNDTGYPIRVETEAPAGFVFGDLLWPAPRRHVSPGELLDHVYRERVTLLLPLRVPEEIRPGETVTLRARTSWLACREACVPGSGEASLTLPILAPGNAGPSVDPSVRDRLTEAEGSLPHPRGENDPRLETSWEESTLVIRVPGARSLAFYPDTASTPLKGLIESGETAGDELRLTLGEEPAESPISGVLAVGEDPSTPTVYFTFREPLPPPLRKEPRS